MSKDSLRWSFRKIEGESEIAEMKCMLLEEYVNKKVWDSSAGRYFMVADVDIVAKGKTYYFSVTTFPISETSDLVNRTVAYSFTINDIINGKYEVSPM